MVHHDRMVNDQIDLGQRVDLIGIAAQLCHGRPHGGQIDDRRNAGEVLHQHACRAEGHFTVRFAVFKPADQ